MSNTDVAPATSTQPPPAQHNEPARRGDTLARIGLLLLRGRTLVVLVLLIILFGTMSQDYLTSGNLIVMTKHVAINAILAIGVTFVILTGGIDLSVGSIAGLSSMIVGGLLFSGLGLPGGGVLYLSVGAVIVVGLLVGCLVGSVNGILITKFRVPPFIATLGMLYVARGHITADLPRGEATEERLVAASASTKVMKVYS